jgi:SAM-dependent methyltransferase
MKKQTLPTTSQPITRCQACGAEQLESVMFLGYIPPVNTMPALGLPPVEQPAYPLEFLRCPSCTLVQIGLEVDADVLFPHSYPYLSGTTAVLRRNFADLYAEASTMLGFGPEDLVIDIGSNDGTLLANFHEGGHRVLGVEPSQAADVARANGIDTLTAYFGPETAADIRQQHGPASLITAANVFAHIGDVHAVIEGILALLDEDGVFVSESHYLLDLVDTLQYDTIYHEHLRYYSLVSLQNLLTSHGLEIFHVKRIPTHGGSIRVYAARKGQRAVQDSVAIRLDDELNCGLTDGAALGAFRDRVVLSKAELHAVLAPLKRDGARIYGIGAPSRASTLVNYTGLDDGLIDCVMEVTGSHKLERYMPGTRIPVLDEGKLYEDQPEYALLLSWHIADELMPILRRKGFKGRFIVPLPEPRIV